jgi:hypothetical protein
MNQASNHKMEPMIDDQSQAISEEVSHSGTKSMMTSASAFSCSAYSPAEFASAPLQQTLPGSGFFRRMPCKARGVEGEHVAKNAFIDIPLNAKHGTILSCSHPACRLSGRLFRFCAVCQVPVAKVSKKYGRTFIHTNRDLFPNPSVCDTFCFYREILQEGIPMGYQSLK